MQKQNTSTYMFAKAMPIRIRCLWYKAAVGCREVMSLKYSRLEVLKKKSLIRSEEMREDDSRFWVSSENVV
jgi:hypothetical protein